MTLTAEITRLKSLAPKYRESALMLDLETLDTIPTASILSIGAVIFDPLRVQTPEELINYGFYCNVDCSMHTEFTESQDTKDWWQRQKPEVYNSLMVNRIPVAEALHALMCYITNHPYKIVTTWANSPSFDLNIIRHACSVTKIPFPLQYWSERDLRTLKAIAYPSGNAPNCHSGPAHNALQDAVAQALLVQHGYRRLGLS